jgi:DnaJ-like protein
VTERKPPGKSWESWFEELIRQAEAEGAFQDLPGAGKPLPDLDKPYDPDWWVKQLVRRERVSVLPPALELLRKVETELTAIRALSSETEVRRRLTALNAAIAKVNASAAEGPPTRLAPLDIEALVADWRRRSAGHEEGR